MTPDALPRVTHILAAVGLDQDLAWVRPDVLETARARGVAVHAAIEAMTYGYLDDAGVDVGLAAYLDAYHKFLHESHYVARVAEIEVTHPTWRYRGHPDSVGLMGTTRCVVDFKTGDLGAAMYQVVAYVDAWNATHPAEPVARGLVVQLRNDGTYRVHEVDLNLARPVWYAALMVFRAQDTNGRERAHEQG